MMPIWVVLLIALGSFYGGAIVVSLLVAASRNDEPVPTLAERLQADQRRHVERYADEEATDG
jgi:hypothetical protein